jgi:hypothetical protein
MVHLDLAGSLPTTLFSLLVSFFNVLFQQHGIWCLDLRNPVYDLD